MKTIEKIFSCTFLFIFNANFYFKKTLSAYVWCKVWNLFRLALQNGLILLPITERSFINDIFTPLQEIDTGVYCAQIICTGTFLDPTLCQNNENVVYHIFLHLQLFKLNSSVFSLTWSQVSDLLFHQCFYGICFYIDIS